MRRTLSSCCAREPSGHAAADPAIPVMKLRPVVERAADDSALQLRQLQACLQTIAIDSSDGGAPRLLWSDISQSPSSGRSSQGFGPV
jgi:hypothetical protein